MHAKTSVLLIKYVLFPIFYMLSLVSHAQGGLKNVSHTLDSIFHHYDQGNQPGLSIAILEKNKPVTLKSYGMANLEYNTKLTPHSLFNAAQLSQQFTVFSILFLQEKGKLSIDDDVKKHLPELKEWPHEIKLHHLMEQTSGLRDVAELIKWKGYTSGDVVTKQEILKLIKNQKTLNFNPGSKVEYNWSGYVLLTEIIERLSGVSFPEFVDKHIFTPLEMDNSMFSDDHRMVIPNRSYSYKKEGNAHYKVSNNSSFVGGSNLYTSASDFAKWLENMSLKKIGHPSFYSYLFTNTILSDGNKTDYTPGIYRDNRSGYWTIHYEGLDHGFSSYMMHIPEHDFSLVYFSNSADISGGELYETIYDWFHKDYEILPQAQNPAQEVTYISKSKQELEMCIGHYLLEENFSLRKIVMENDTLFYERNENNKVPMVPIEGNLTFKMIIPNNDKVRVSFLDSGQTLEYRFINTGEKSDFVTHGRKLKTLRNEQSEVSGQFKNEVLNQVIKIDITDHTAQVTMGETIVNLEHIGDDEFLAPPNSTVRLLKLNRDQQQRVTGAYLSGWRIKNLYYSKN